MDAPIAPACLASQGTPATTTFATRLIRTPRRCIRCSPKPSSARAHKWRLRHIPPARWPRADRARRHRVSLLAEDPLRSLLDPGPEAACYHGMLTTPLVARGTIKSSRRSGEAGLREPGDEALVGRARPAQLKKPPRLLRPRSV
jgi:hypothetical protein